MITLPITLPEEMLIFLEVQAAARKLAGPGEYLQVLIAAAQNEQELVELEVRFADAIRAVKRGDANPLSAGDWDQLRRRVLSQDQPPVANA